METKPDRQKQWRQGEEVGEKSTRLYLLKTKTPTTHPSRFPTTKHKEVCPDVQKLEKRKGKEKREERKKTRWHRITPSCPSFTKAPLPASSSLVNPPMLQPSG
jgi:hypothetical protein